MKRFFSVQAAAAVLLLLAGGTVMLGWIVRDPALLQLRPGVPAMVFNAALGFCLLGAALGLPCFSLGCGPRIERALGAALIALGGAVLLQYMSGLDLLIDGASWQSWLHSGNNVMPGRMAPGVCLAFVLAGAVLLWGQRVRSRAAGFAVQGATFTIFLFGFIGLASYFLRLDLLYAWFPPLRMSAPAALAMIAGSIGLWSSWRQAEWYRSRRYFKDDEKISYVGATILSVIALGAGVVGFAVQQSTLETTFMDSLQERLRSQIILFQTVLRQSAANAESAARRPHFMMLLRELDGGAPPPQARRELELIGRSVLASGMSGIAMYDRGGHEILRLGHFGTRGASEVELGLPQPGALFWDDGLYLHSRIALSDAGRVLGSIVIEQPLPILMEQFVEAEGPGQSGRLGLCAPRGAALLCFPQRQNQAMYTIARANSRGVPTPMSRAVSGQSGVFMGPDYRDVAVLAAFGPLTSTGLGIAVKQDAAELYRPIREQLQVYALLLIVIVGGGAALLRSQVTPLVTQLLRSEREASEREWHIHTVVDNVGEGIITLDEQGVIESFNRAAARIFGYPAEEAIGRSVEMLMPPELRAAHVAGMRRLAAGGQPGHPAAGMQDRHKDGTLFQLEMAINQIRIGERHLFVGIVRDVTAQKQAERALQESEARSREITATLGEGIFVTDREGHILFTNPAAQRLVGWSEAELQGRCAHTLLHHTRADGTSCPAAACPIHQVLHSGQSFRSHDDAFWRKDGSMLPVSVNATPIVRDGAMAGSVVAFHDIIERKKAERALLAESAKNAMLLRTASDGIHVLDLHGNVVQVNDAFCRMLGYTPEQMRGMNVAQWDVQWAGEELKEIVRQLLDRDTLFETRLRRRDGSELDVEVHAGGVVINGEQLLYASARDISERKKAAQQVHHLAHFDILTDLPNRALLGDRLRQALATAKRLGHAHLALMFVDLDKFKPVNDTFGHHIGDLLLTEVAARVQACLRESDTVARVGGDEFVVLLPQIEAEHDALRVAQKILGTIGAPFLLEGHALQISASIGIATYPQHGADQESLLKNADRAMYHAKQGGGGAIFSFSQLEAAA